MLSPDPIHPRQVPRAKNLNYQIIRLSGKDIAQTSRLANLAMSQHNGVFTEEEMQEKFSPQKYERAFNNPLGFFFGAFEQENLLGFCGGGFLKNLNAEGAIITEIFIDPVCQKRGIGRDLLQVLEPFLFAKKDRIWIEAVRDILDFYLKMGYKVKENVPHLNKRLVFVEKLRPPVRIS